MHRKFEYSVTRHPSKTFRTLAWFCSERGECDVNRAPGDQIHALEEILNGQGAEGWEMVHASFASTGMVAIWKREIMAEIIVENAKE